MLTLAVVGLGGFVGAIARYGVSLWVQRQFEHPFPFGTLAVNVLGCLVIGVLLTLVQERQLFSSATRMFLVVGLLGSFTTFSTLGFETFELLRGHEPGLAVANVTANAVVGVAAVALGRALVLAAAA